MAKKKKKAEKSEIKRMPGEFDEQMVEISDGDYRHYLQGAYAFGGYGDFKGEVLRYEKSKGYLFKYLFVSFMEWDGNIIDGKEDHVWVYDCASLKEAGVKSGDKVSFSGTVYAYHRMDKEHTRDYGIKNLENIKIIDEYSLPSDKFLERQGLEGLVCDTLCMYNDQCVGMCIAPDGWKEKMIDTLLSSNEKEMTGFLVNGK